MALELKEVSIEAEAVEILGMIWQPSEKGETPLKRKAFQKGYSPDQMGQGKSVREWWARPSLPFHQCGPRKKAPPSKFVVRSDHISLPTHLCYAMLGVEFGRKNPKIPYC